MISATVVGNVGADPELKYTNDGTAVLNLSVASNSGRGEQQSTTWVRAALFGKRAEGLHPYIAKGDRIALCGRVELREYDRRDGGKGHSLEMRIDDVELLGGRKPDGAPAQQQQQRPAQALAQQQQRPAGRARF